MSKVDEKKRIALERITHHLMMEGLHKSGLRLLADVAGTSDRMLIYYFGSKEALLDQVLGGIAANFTAQLDLILGSERRSAERLLAQLTELIANEAFRPALQLWFELVGLAARGDEPYLSNARVLSDNWVAWIGARLDDPAVDAADLYAHLEGRVMLSLLYDESAARS